jgi:hypothetical protein
MTRLWPGLRLEIRRSGRRSGCRSGCRSGYRRWGRGGRTKEGQPRNREIERSTTAPTLFFLFLPFFCLRSAFIAGLYNRVKSSRAPRCVIHEFPCTLYECARLGYSDACRCLGQWVGPALLRKWLFQRLARALYSRLGFPPMAIAFSRRPLDRALINAC